jgi:hypothetical protein
MMGLLRTLALCMGAFLWAALPAYAVEVMVVGNASPESGLTTDAAAKKLRGLMMKLYSYEGVKPIVYAANLPKAELEPRLKEFEGRLAGSDFAIFYYLGIGAHDAKGASYLVPYGWKGDKSELVPLERVLAAMQSFADGKSLLIADTVKPAPGWKYEGIFPGLGDIQREAQTAGGGVLIAYNLDDALATKDGTRFTASLEKRVSGPMQLRQLASLMQEDVSFETGGAKVPRLAGAIKVSLQLTPAAQEGISAGKKQMCTAANEQASANFAAASTDSDPSSSEPAVMAASVIEGKPRKSGSILSWFFCPGIGDEEETPNPRKARPYAEPPSKPRGKPIVSYRSRGGDGGHASGGGGGGTPAAVRVAVPGG